MFLLHAHVVLLLDLPRRGPSALKDRVLKKEGTVTPIIYNHVPWSEATRGILNE